MLESPTLERQGLFLLAVSVAASVRLQALLLLPALLLAAGLYAWFGRSTAVVRRLGPTLGAVGLATVALVVLSVAGEDVLGAYGEVATGASSSAGLVSQLGWHAGTLVLTTLVLPVLATATLVVLAALAGEDDPRVRALLAAASAYTVLVVGQVSLFAVDNLDHVSERYLLTALPPLALGLAVWIRRGAPRPAFVVAPLALFAVLLVATIPPSRVGTALAAHDTLTVLPLAQLVAPAGEELRVLLVVGALAAAAAFLLLPRRLLAGAVVVLGAAFLAISLASAADIDDLSEVERRHDFGTAEPTWVDDAGAGDAVLFDTGELPSTAISRLTFWNRSIRELVRLDDVPKRALPEVAVRIRRDGALTVADGSEVSAPWAVVPAGVALAGERVTLSPPTDVAPGSGLWRVVEPLRLVSRATGFTPVGDFQRATVVVYRCGPGVLELTLLGKDGAPVVARVNGFPNETFEVPPLTNRAVAIRPVGITPGEPCVFELESAGLVGSTRVAWVPR
jgi:hypothetical protein